jgi:hypothetical protein
MKAEELFEYLKGTWKITKTLGDLGIASGEAKIIPNQEGYLHYREDVLITINNSEVKGYKEYLYSMKDDVLSKHFTDLNLFYHLNLGQYSATGHHQCSEDHYDASYAFLADNSFTLEYKVHGPKKDYIISTEFVRMIKDPLLMGLATDE